MEKSMNSSAQPTLSTEVQIRRAKVEDANECGRICYEAFRAIAEEHNFPPDFPVPEIAIGILRTMFSHPGYYCVVAEQGGRIVGSNCLDERTPIAGIGPVTVDPAAQNQQTGRRLMQAVMERAAVKKFAGTRLVQAAYHNRTMALYTRLGFTVREPLACMQGPALRKALWGYEVRRAEARDLEACNTLCAQVHGHDRGGELRDAINQGEARVAERDGVIRGYSSAMAFFGHAVAAHNEAMQALIAAAEAFQGPGILVPTRNAELFQWCLANCLRIVHPMTLMSTGLYNEPVGAFLPSVLF
jgi:GNAT superfamily N-acetyltransferase